MASSPQSSLSSADSDIEAPPPRPPSTGIKRAASIAFSDHSPTSTHHPRRRPPPPQVGNQLHFHDFDDHHHIHQHATSLSDISSDTSGSVPGSPRDHHNDDGEFAEQVTVCRWAGCNADLGNMDALVKHIHDGHIGSRKAKYACEWDDCSRKGMTHASGYALRAHMRSHTREKPFYCTLPECDRSFTRSDALAKHMRTVHETEALRPSDPIPKSHPNHPQNVANTAYADALFRRQSKAINTSSNGDGSFRVMQLNNPITHSPSLNGHPSIKPTIPTANSIVTKQESDSDAEENDSSIINQNKKSYYLPTDPFSPEDEIHRPPRELYKYLKQKLKWAQAAQDDLQRDLEMYAKRRREAWVKKELLLERCVKMELGEDVGAASIFWEKGKTVGGAGGNRPEDEEMKEVDDEDDEGEEGGVGRVGLVRDGEGEEEEDEEGYEDGGGEAGEDEYATEEE
ncbi:hypothetical protein EV426DRAFT_535926 [Tirmania nivea]|nr:hypothetical protein EV426DRAFT_535926 [Tirmania nivea]